MELEWEELFTKFNEANQTIKVLRFENNFLTEKTKKLDAKLFYVKAQLERASSTKLDEMLNFAASDKTSLGYGYSLSSCSMKTRICAKTLELFRPQILKLQLNCFYYNLSKCRTRVNETQSLDLLSEP